MWFWKTISRISVDNEVQSLRTYPPFPLPETGFRQLSLDISGETSSALQVLLGRVKPVWAGAQGYHGGWASTEWEPLSTTLYWWFAPTNSSVSGTSLQLKGGYVVESNKIRDWILVWPKATRVRWNRESKPRAVDNHVAGQIYLWRSIWMVLLWIPSHNVWVASVVHL